MRTIRMPGLILGGVGSLTLLWGCGSAAPPASQSPPPAAAAPAASAIAPVTSINELMVTMIDNASHVLWDVEVEGQAPKDEADWLEVEDHALQIAAAGTLIQLGGTGPSDAAWVKETEWSTSAGQMSQAALAARQAAKDRNLEALVTANGQLVASCEACHDKFKPNAPTEGILHQRPHSESHHK